MRSVLAGLAAVLFASACGSEASSGAAAYEAGRVIATVQGAALKEASGFVPSARHPGIFWVHNDSGDEPLLYAMDSTGHVRAVLVVQGARNVDWEDIARRGDTLFVADIGDNDAERGDLMVYAVVEPDSLQNEFVQPVAATPVRYPDGPRDAEAFLVDPLSGDWFVISKRDQTNHLYRWDARSAGDSVRQLALVTDSLRLGRVTAGDVSEGGREVLVKSYDAVFYWTRRGDESLAATLQRAPLRQPYASEPLGEAITFARDGSSYYTISERGRFGAQELLRYHRHIPVDGVDHAYLASDTAAALFAVLRDSIGLPEVWAFANRAGGMSGGLSLGNMVLEVMQRPAGAPRPDALEGVALRPHANTRETIATLNARGIETGRPVRIAASEGSAGWVLTGLAAFSEGNVFLCEYLDKASVRREREAGAVALARVSGSSLGLVGVDALVISRRDSGEHVARWSVMSGLPRVADDRIEFREGPAVRVVAGERDALVGLVLRVRSVERAQAALGARLGGILQFVEDSSVAPR